MGLQLNEHISEPGGVLFRHACKMGLEGIVSKRLGSSYRSGRSTNWLKMKNPDCTSGDTGGRGRLGAEANDVDGQDHKPLPQPDLFFGGRNCHADAGA